MTLIEVKGEEKAEEAEVTDGISAENGSNDGNVTEGSAEVTDTSDDNSEA